MITLHEGLNELNVEIVPVTLPTATLYGVVIDADTGLPLQGVRVTIEGDGVFTTTNQNGQYSLSGIIPGSYVIGFNKDGYHTLIL